MRLFHASEESDIRVFEPRKPSRADLDPNVGLVWAIDEARLPNFLTPRNCPRVAWHVSERTTTRDRTRFFSSPTMTHAVAIEGTWLERMRSATLVLYEFAPDDFELQDDAAGYYVAKTAQSPIAKFELTDLLAELVRRNVELRIVDNLWPLADEIQTSTLNWSLCRMAFSQPRR